MNVSSSVQAPLSGGTQNAISNLLNSPGGAPAKTAGIGNQVPPASIPTALGQNESGVDKTTISAEGREMLENDLKANPQGQAEEASVNEDWKPDRLKSFEMYVIFKDDFIPLDTPVPLDGKEKQPRGTLETFTVSPQWYDDLATVKNTGVSADLTKEYHGLLKEAMNQTLDEKVPESSNNVDLANLFRDKDKSQSIQESLMANLAKNTRATELMGILGISLTGASPK